MFRTQDAGGPRRRDGAAGAAFCHACIASQYNTKRLMTAFCGQKSTSVERQASRRDHECSIGESLSRGWLATQIHLCQGSSKHSLAAWLTPASSLFAASLRQGSMHAEPCDVADPSAAERRCSFRARARARRVGAPQAVAPPRTCAPPVCAHLGFMRTCACLSWMRSRRWCSLSCTLPVLGVKLHLRMAATSCEASTIKAFLLRTPGAQTWASFVGS